jgi:hypothetical protein
MLCSMMGAHLSLTKLLSYTICLNIKTMKIVRIPRMLQHFAFRDQDVTCPGLDFFMTAYGPAHFDSYFPSLSVHGLHKRTRSPTSKAFGLTFGSLHAFVSV